MEFRDDDTSTSLALTGFMFRALGCPMPYDTGNPYWAHFALVAFLLTWGVVVRRREQLPPRLLLGALSVGGWLIAFAILFLDRRADDEDFYRALLQAASFTTGCVFFQILTAPRREQVPRAILVHDQGASGGTREDTDGNANQRA